MSIISSGRVVETREGVIVISSQQSTMTLEETWNVADIGGALPGDSVEVHDDGSVIVVNRPEPEKLIIAPTQLPPQEA